MKPTKSTVDALIAEVRATPVGAAQSHDDAERFYATLAILENHGFECGTRVVDGVTFYDVVEQGVDTDQDWDE